MRPGRRATFLGGNGAPPESGGQRCAGGGASLTAGLAVPPPAGTNGLGRVRVRQGVDTEAAIRVQEQGVGVEAEIMVWGAEKGAGCGG